ncbi:DNA translocase Ecym_1481 [Eremothecium cymbalariae DBVPG|uniref:ISWI chromatin-remodeling complex ATPase ISW2 n=1 Tax=Eremothecium cymbalariae (strain CBS 270.75 / DBVPG 7215 / KCTC 17166 / NRRL Y-17582) TaxID=931890 RepID=G8JMI9_ERECY|nr:hypothetical protein Ecym_1481 [Eremothecium cymbalariae DBVPG\
MSETITKDSKYWKDRKKRFLLDVDAKVAKQRDKDDTYVRFKHLLGLTDLFRHFIGMRAKRDKNMQKLLRMVDGESRGNNNKSLRNRDSSRHYRKTEKEEDAELIQDEEGRLSETTVLTESPNYVKAGKLREYQIYGLNWLISLHENKLSGILADEMGLGKTLQTISFLGYLKFIKNIDGPFIVVVPKSTLDNWKREFSKWTPDVRTLILQGDKETRAKLLEDRILSCDFDVLITSYEMVIKEKAALKKFAWQYIVIDEAHRIKNEQSTLSQIIRLFYSKGRLLITGTPLQNNLHELWALLNFLLPDVFGESEVFDEWFQQNDKDQDQEVVVQQLHAVLQPFLLRRVKAEVEKSLLPKIETNVYVGMAGMQLQWYKSLLEKDIDAVNGAVAKREGKTRLLNIVMQLRKCCNHPYLFEGAEPGPPFTTDEHLIYNSGKMIVLDKLLKRKQMEGSRVLIFSQMSRLLDILEDYCYFREYEYCRMDGSTSHEERIQAIDDFNAPDSNKFIFLLTTRAGGLGINLVTADTVVLYDSDWNPQADLQAMDRAHRIGQKKQVHVYRFVTENAIEEKVIERAAQKLRLDQLVIQQGTGKKSANLGNSKDELIDMIQFGAKDVFDKKSTEVTMDDDIDEILKKGEQKTQKLNAKYEALGLDDLQKFNGMADQSAYEWNGTIFEKKKTEAKSLEWINPSRRERRREQTYSVDDYYKEIIGGAANKNSSKTTPQPKMPKAPRAVLIQDFQFPSPNLNFLQEKEQLSYKRKINYKVASYDLGSDDEEDDGSISERIASEQAKIDNAEEFTEEDELMKQKCIDESFTSWTKREFITFINGSSKFGRTNFKAIASMLENKTVKEVEEYGNVFWSRYKEIQGYEKYLNTIEAGERKTEKLRQQESLLKMKIAQCESPLHEMIIQYPPNNARRTYNSMEDKFILITVNKYGLFSDNLYDKVKQEIMKCNLFHFDWFIRTRSVHELSKRVTTLLTMITREYEGPDSAAKRKRKTKDDTPAISNGDRGVSTGLDPSEQPLKKIRAEEGVFVPH